MANELVTIYHPEAGTGQVPESAVESYRESGWSTEPPKETSDEAKPRRSKTPTRPVRPHPEKE